jgi:hypothetical protein
MRDLDHLGRFTINLVDTQDGTRTPLARHTYIGSLSQVSKILVTLDGDPRSILAPGRTYRVEIFDTVKDLSVSLVDGLSSIVELKTRLAIEIVDYVPKESRAPRSSIFNITVTVPKTEIIIDKCILEAAGENGIVLSLTVDADFISQTRIVCTSVGYPYTTITLATSSTTSSSP